MVRKVLGAVSCALVLAAGSASGRADGALNSLSDLDGGAAQNWRYIAPGASADKKPADALTNAAAQQGGTSAAPGHKITPIGENLMIEPPPPPPKKPVSSLWFSQPPGSK